MGGKGLLQALEPAIVNSLHEFVDQGRGGGEADLPALLAGGQTEPEGDVCLARAARSQSDGILPAVDELAACQLHGQRLVERRDHHEVEAVEALGRRELRGLDAALDHPPFPLDQLEFTEPQQVLDMILALGRTLPGKLGMLGLEGGQLELPEVVLEQYLRRLAHEAAPDISLR